jgi:light-regulated signal transduction histidine kinase (bacteriophytochrome)
LPPYLDAGEGSGLGKRVEVVARRRDGSEFPAEMALVRIRSEGAPVFTGYIRDITERRKAEEVEILRTAKNAAEEANAELETFSYSVAHDLRAPLRAISGFSTALTEDCADQLDDRARDHLARITASADRMAKLIDALLGLSRLTRTEPRREKVDLTRMAQAVVQQLQSSQPDRVANIRVADNLVADGDAQLLRALLENLLGNAWKFTSKKSEARIEFGREGWKDGPVYYVRDNGAGFNMSFADKLFAPFRRLHKDSDFEGTGIGLATVQRIVRRHGGQIWAEGAIDQGATFRFTLGARLGPTMSWAPIG